MTDSFLTNQLKSLILENELNNYKDDIYPNDYSASSFYIDICNEEFYIYNTDSAIKKKLSIKDSFTIEKSNVYSLTSTKFENIFINKMNFHRFNSNDYLFIKKFLILLISGNKVNLNNLDTITKNYFNEHTYFNYLSYSENKGEIYLNLTEKVICFNDSVCSLMLINLNEEYFNEQEHLIHNKFMVEIFKNNSKLYLKMKSRLSNKVEIITINESAIDAYYSFFREKPINLDLNYFNDVDIQNINIKDAIFY